MGAITIPLEGQPYLGDNPQIVKVAKCTLAYSGGDVNTGASQATFPLFNIPAGTLVLEMLCVTTVAWTASVTINVGDGDDTSGWLATAKVAPTSQVTTGILKSSLRAAAETYGVGKKYAAADTIDAVVAGATPGVGTTDFYLVYIEDSTQL
jgi:hypothetical protein